MKFNLINEGTCTRVKLFGEDVRKTFLLNEFKDASLEEASYIFINTCNFLKVKEEDFLKQIKELSTNLKDNQKICVIGCLPSGSKDELLNINKNIILLSRKISDIEEYFKLKKHLKYLSTELNEKLNPKKKCVYILNKLFLHNKHIEFRLKKNKVCHIQISCGCLGKCSYCTEKYTTNLKSRLIKDILDGIYDGLQRGFKLFSLNSDDASAFGKDNNESLEELLKAILDINEKFYLCIPEFNPNGLTPKVIEFLKDERLLYITIPIQSGSNKILKLMKRPYKIENVLDKIKTIKANNKKIKINTHVIVGFPGETKEDYAKTKVIIKEGYFDRLKIFEYSDKEKAQSYKLNDKIDNRTKEKRRKELRKLILINSIKKLSIADIILNMEII